MIGGGNCEEIGCGLEATTNKRIVSNKEEATLRKPGERQINFYGQADELHILFVWISFVNASL